MSNRTKPLSLVKGNHLTKEQKDKRLEAEQKAKGETNDVLNIPDFIDDEAKEVYKYTLKVIGPDGADMLSDADKESLTTYCVAVSILKQSAQSIRDYGLIIEGKANPAVKMFENYSKIVKSFSNAFGLDPFSRSKLVISNSRKSKGIDLNTALEDLENMFA